MAYGYYRALTIDRTKVPNTNQTDFPVLISGTYSWLATVANGGKVQHASGYDIAFYSDVALTTQLKHETERWVATTGEVVYWVKVPTVSTSVDTVIYIAYGDTSISTDQSDAANVWDANYKAVWHLPDGTTLTALDSTSNNNDGTLVNTPTAAAGKIDGGGSFASADSEYISAGTAASLEVNAFTAEAWVNPTTLPAGGVNMIASKSDSILIAGVEWGVFTTGTFATAWYDTAVRGWYESTGTVPTAADTHLVITRNGATIKFYKNGALDSTITTASAGTITYAGDLVRIGSQIQNNFWNGKLDEIRISNTDRSGDWVATSYNNQNSPSTFYSVGNENGRVGEDYAGIPGLPPAWPQNPVTLWL